MKNAVKTALLLSSSLIGAGFATGREICEFFPPDGIFGLLNAVFSCFLICLFTFLIIKKGNALAENITYRIFVFLFLVCMESAMFAGASYFPYGRIILAVLVVITYIAGITGIETAAVILTPIIALYIIASAVIFGDMSICERTHAESHPFIYAGYNVIYFPILLKSIKIEKPLSVSVFLFIIMAPLIAAVSFLTQDFADFEIPLSNAVGESVFFGIILFFAMYTTAACSAFCMSDIAGKRYGYVGIFLSFITSFFGFGSIVSSGYRIFGIIGFALCIFLILNRRNMKKYGENSRNREKINC